MPAKKKSSITFDKNQRRLTWTMLFLTVLAAIFLFILSYRLRRLEPLPLPTPAAIIPALFQGETFSETALLELPALAAAGESSFLASPDGRRFAYVLKTESSQQLVLDESAGPLVDKITFWSFSADSKHFAYTVKEGSKEWAIVDGVPGTRYDWIFSPRFFTPDSAYFVYKARVSGGKDVLVVNGRETRAYDRIYEPIISPEKDALIFFARDGQQLWRGEVPLRPDWERE